jgi:hypothetical protein
VLDKPYLNRHRGRKGLTLQQGLRQFGAHRGGVAYFTMSAGAAASLGRSIHESDSIRSGPGRDLEREALIRNCGQRQLPSGWLRSRILSRHPRSLPLHGARRRGRPARALEDRSIRPGGPPRASRSSRNDLQISARAAPLRCYRLSCVECSTAALRAVPIWRPCAEPAPRMPVAHQKRRRYSPKPSAPPRRAVPHIRDECRGRAGPAPHTNKSRPAVPSVGRNTDDRLIATRCQTMRNRHFLAWVIAAAMAIGKRPP